MARGNSWDGRLDRTAAIAVLLMEALEKFRHKFHYSIIGHSGSTAALDLVDFDRPPSTPDEKYAVIEKIYSKKHMSCFGDHFELELWSADHLCPCRSRKRVC